MFQLFRQKSARGLEQDLARPPSEPAAVPQQGDGPVEVDVPPERELERRASSNPMRCERLPAPGDDALVSTLSGCEAERARRLHSALRRLLDTRSYGSTGSGDPRAQVADPRNEGGSSRSRAQAGPCAARRRYRRHATLVPAPSWRPGRTREENRLRRAPVEREEGSAPHVCRVWLHHAPSRAPRPDQFRPAAPGVRSPARRGLSPSALRFPPPALMTCAPGGDTHVGARPSR